MVDAEGKTVSSIKVANDEADIVALITDAGSQATQVVWAIDIIRTPSALLLALLARPTSQCVMHPGESLRRSARPTPEKARPTPKTPTSLPRLLACAGTSSARVVDTGTDLVRELAVVTGHRADLIADRVRTS